MNEVDISIQKGNSPFGAILIDKDGNVIEKTHNTAKSECNPILHEINLISEAWLNKIIYKTNRIGGI